MAVCFLNCGPGTRPFHYIERLPVETVRVIPIVIDGAFTNADRVGIKEAVDEWNKGMNGSIRLEIVDWNFRMELEKILKIKRDHGWIFMGVWDNGELVKRHDKDNHKTLAWVNRIQGDQMYLVIDRVPGKWVKEVAMHEIGHLMGAWHKDRLMKEYFTEEEYSCIDKGTMEQVSDAWKIPLEKLVYCIEDPK